MTNPLINTFQEIIPLSINEIELVETLFSTHLYRRKQCLLQENDVCNTLNFVVNGCLRMYKTNEKGNIHIVQFASENTWIANMNSFYSQTPSEFCIDAIEDTTVRQITRSDLYRLYTEFPKFNRIFRVLVEEAYMKLQKRLLVSISASAQQKYLYFTQTYPHLLQRLPQTQVAAFLGITPVSLSNVKADFLRGKQNS